jgi:MoxR-like ATPase
MNMSDTSKNANPAEKKSSTPKKIDYFSRTFYLPRIAMLIACGLAFILLVFLVLVVMTSGENRFHFQANGLTNAFLVILLLLLIDMIGMCFVRVLSTNDMPSYDDFKRGANSFEDTKKLSRFPELLQYDKDHPTFEKVESDPDLTLQGFCTNFRDFMAARAKPLYYSEGDVRRFVASLTVSRTMILQGMSGTGKTSLAVAFGEFIGTPSVVVPVQPMWKERSDLLGYYNEFTRRFNETAILETVYAAGQSDAIRVIVLDELNIARVEYYFSEFLSLLELPAGDARQLVVAASGAYGDPKRMAHGRILLPDNVWFLGTANNDDSTFAISDKVYDRAMVLDLDRRAEPRKPAGEPSGARVSAAELLRLADEARARRPLSDAALGRIARLDAYLSSVFRVSFGNRIMAQIRAYAPVLAECGGSEGEAVDDMLSKKVIRKLEGENPVFVKSHAEELIDKLNEIFGEGNMPECEAHIRRIAGI